MTPAASALVLSGNPDVSNMAEGVLARWERVQSRFGQDLPIRSGYRGASRNRAAKGARRSQHMGGKALDIDVSSLPRDERLRLIRIASTEGFNGIGVYNNALHFDTRAERNAWGPSHSKGNPKTLSGIPAWARETISNHLGGRFVLAGGGGADTLAGGPQSDYFNSGGAAAQETPQAPQGGGSPYFNERLQQAAPEAEPQVQTAAPAPPTGMDDSPAPEAGGVVQGVRDWVAGTGDYDVPELEMSPEGMASVAGEQSGPERRALANALFLADNEQAMANIIQDFAPDVPIVADSKGNLYADVNGKRYALDKSGWSQRDLYEVAQGIFAAAGITKAAKMLGKFGNVGRMVGASSAAAAEQAGAQIVSNMVGGDQPFDFGRVALGAAFGLAGEGLGIVVERLGPRVVSAIGRAVSGTPDEFELRLLEAGVDPERIRAAFQSLPEEQRANFGPDALARLAAARDLEVPVELTAGQATRDQALFNREAIQRGTTAFGSDVKELAQEKAAAQQAALAENARRLTGDEGNVLDRGAAVQDELVSRRGTAKAEVDAAYERARKAPGQARVAAGPIRSFVNTMRARTRERAVPSAMPLTMETLDELEQMLAAASGARVTALDVRALEAWRSQLSGTREGAQGSDRAGLTALARAYDAAMASAFKSGIVSGDANTLGMWRNAARLRAKFGRNYEQDDIVGRLTAGAKRRRGELQIDAEDVMGEILGKSTLGSRGGARREVLRLKKVLGADSPQFAAIKAQALVQLLGFEPGSYAGGQISAKIVNNLRTANKNHPGLVSAIFDDAEIRAIRRFATVVEAVNTPVRQAGDPNPSGSAMLGIEAASEGIERLGRAVEVLARQFGPGGMVLARFVLRAVEDAGQAAQSTAMRRSLQGLPPVPAPPPNVVGVGGAAGGAAAGQF